MKERPIIFSGAMVRAILDGRKTQTRRIMNPQPTPHFTIDVDYWTSGPHTGELGRAPNSTPYGMPGDRLRVRETFGLLDTQSKDGPDKATVFYRATDGDRRELRHQLWRPSIFMPRWASRIALEITGVRVERLQDISEEDAAAEGMSHYDGGWSSATAGPVGLFAGARAAFTLTWDAINGKRAPWASNPWVWVVSFKRVQP